MLGLKGLKILRPFLLKKIFKKMLTNRNDSYKIQSRTNPNKEVLKLQKRNTPQKRIVMQTLADMGNHPTASMVYENVHKEHPTISKSTVFRILGNAATDGDVLRLHMAESDDRFDHQCHDHYHIRCIDCGRVDDVEMPYLSNIYSQITDTQGYQIMGHDIEFRGVCNSCRRRDII